MTHEDIEKRISDKLWKKKPAELPPTVSEWEQLEGLFGCRFPAEFRMLHDLMAKYMFEGDYLYVAPTDGEDDVASVYNYEKSLERNWPVELIPFYSVGNGDYLCLKSSECPDTAVYYIYHEDDSVELIHESLAAWIQDPEWFP